MERLWTPWRMEYVKGADLADGCFLCDAPAAGDDGATYILHRGENAFVILNIYPYNSGHLMVAPYRHAADIEELEPDEAVEGWSLLLRSVRVLREAMAPQGFNIGMNLGRVAGAGVPDHLHFHVVPRWGGDTNFMPVTGAAKVLPELLDETYARLKPLFEESA
ncbi:MAG TPA: HIT domain-containing protein [Actinomycetota bacterium]|nr:HIT domain-containing protein [Actinomycetota bacterium]